MWLFFRVQRIVTVSQQVHVKPTCLEKHVYVPWGSWNSWHHNSLLNQMCIQVHVSYSFVSQLVLHMRRITFNRSPGEDLLWQGRNSHVHFSSRIELAILSVCLPAILVLENQLWGCGREQQKKLGKDCGSAHKLFQLLPLSRTAGTEVHPNSLLDCHCTTVQTLAHLQT